MGSEMCIRDRYVTISYHTYSSIRNTIGAIVRTRLTIGEGAVAYRPGTLPGKEKPTRVRTAVLLYREQSIRVSLTTNKETEATCTQAMSLLSSVRGHARCRALPDEREKCCFFGITYSTAISAEVNSISILETKIISKVIRKEKKTNVKV